jgi:protease-4
MSDPLPPTGASPTLQPAQAVPPAGYAGPSTGPPGVPQQPPGPPFPRRKRRSTLLVVLLIMCALGLVVSVAVNLAFVSDLGLGMESAGAMKKTVTRSGDSSQTVAVYVVEGVLLEPAVARFRQFYNTVADDDDIQAVVLRVNSPGGGVTASDQICEMVKDLRSGGKKVVVSMGAVAASGGYYISAPADEIYAEATTVTGSIGVIAGWVAVKGTLDKIGAELVIIKSSHAEGWKDAWRGLAPPHDYQRRHIRDVLDKMQERFEEVVQAGRGKRLNPQPASYEIPPTREGAQPVRHEETEPFNGKIYLAERALELGLIDRIGYEDAAIQRAANLAGLKDERVVRYSRRKTFMETLMDSQADASLKLDRRLLESLRTPRLMMLWQVD